MSLADRIIFNNEQDAINAIKNGANVNEYDQYGFRPLIQTIICKKPKVMQYLLDNGADIEQMDILGKTPLQWAADRSEIEYCKILLEHNANPNHYSADGQPILVNPILREEYDLVNLLTANGAKYEFAQDFISAKLIGHRFELGGEIDIAAPNGKFIPLSFEGFYLEFTCDLIKRSLNNFINSIPGQKFKKYHTKLTKIIMALKHAAQLMVYAKHKDKTPFWPIIDSLLEHDLQIIPVGHKGHAITFVKYGDIFAKCDRGVDNIVDTVLLYKVNNPFLLNKDFYKTLIYQPKTDDFINKEIKEILSLKYLQKLPTKSQIAGNCSWANVEASVIAALFALSYQEKFHDRISTGDLKRSIISFYSAWVEWDKDSALEEAINDFDNTSNERKISKAMILSSILVQRSHYKRNNEVARAKKIISYLAIPEFKFILENIRNTYNKPKSGNVGKNIIKLLETCDLDLKTLELKNLKKHQSTSNHNEIKMTTSLHVACLNGQYEAVKYLIEKAKIDVNYQDRTGSTALMYAAWKGYLNIVKYLVNKCNADVNITNLKGGTAKRYAQYAGNTEVVDFLNSKL